MIKLKYVVSACSMALILLILQGCSSVELAIDLYKKQKRETTEDAVVAAWTEVGVVFS